MLRRFESGDVLTVPVGEGRKAVAQVVEKMRGMVLLAVFPELYDADAALDVGTLGLDEPIFLVETMDQRLKKGEWPVIGNREVSPGIRVPVYKVWVEPPGEFRTQDIHGNVGDTITAARAEELKRPTSFTNTAVEEAIRGMHGLAPWYEAFEKMVYP
ncbi:MULTISPECIES: Imm26 family immunity protein [unclassified Streptomyces]|uniref:Imm26 family immunity protein n=1 Tax=unclassified Streptomyces TaxID=2593676 RepID=UPI00278C7366|nr:MULTISPECIES: Imm26 family immunity protein [unclassified Streptomyces]